jgi:hypothetical protein
MACPDCDNPWAEIKIKTKADIILKFINYRLKNYDKSTKKKKEAEIKSASSNYQANNFFYFTSSKSTSVTSSLPLPCWDFPLPGCSGPGCDVV